METFDVLNFLGILGGFAFSVQKAGRFILESILVCDERAKNMVNPPFMFHLHLQNEKILFRQEFELKQVKQPKTAQLSDSLNYKLA